MSRGMWFNFIFGMMFFILAILYMLEGHFQNGMLCLIAGYLLEDRYDRAKESSLHDDRY